MGRKSHGDTNALHILMAGHSAAKSAPANLSASLSDSLVQPLERSLTMSSGTESMLHSGASASSTCSGRCSVRRIPVIDDSPKGALFWTSNARYFFAGGLGVEGRAPLSTSE